MRRSPRLADTSRSSFGSAVAAPSTLKSTYQNIVVIASSTAAAFMPRPQVTSTTMSGKNAVAGRLARIWMTASDGLRQFGLRPSQ